MGHLVSVDLDPDLLANLDAWAQTEERPRSGLLRRLIRQAVTEWATAQDDSKGARGRSPAASRAHLHAAASDGESAP